MTLPEKLLKAGEAATARPWVENNEDGYSTGTIWSRMTPSGSGPPGLFVAEVIGDSAEAEANADYIVLAANSAEHLARGMIAARALVTMIDDDFAALPAHDAINTLLDSHELAALRELLEAMG